MPEDKKVLSEEDGKIYATIPEEEPEEEVVEVEKEFTVEELESEDDEPEETKEVVEEKEEKVKEVIEVKETDEDEVKEKYQGKSAEELIQMLDSRDVTIGKQGTELSSYKEKDPELYSKDELKEKLTSDDMRVASLKIRADIRAARTKLEGLNSKAKKLDSDMDGEKEIEAAETEARTAKEELDEMLITQDELELDLGQKIADEKVNAKFTSQDNTKFLTEKKAEFAKDLGIPGEDFDKIVDAAKGYIGEDGKLTLDILGKGMIDLKNFEGVAKMYENKGNNKARKEIKTAVTKEESKVSTTKKGGKGTRTIQVTDDLSMKQTRKIVENMTDEELWEGTNRR